jgi:23S rRNA (guanine745-N1)-methyltransferase
MVAARDRFLSAGHYRPIVAGLLDLLRAEVGAAPRVLEVGSGTGYYLAGVLEGLPGSRGMALDVSVAASRRAARAHPRLGAVVADVWQRVPLVDGCCDVVLNVFAPRNAAEFRRVLATPTTPAKPSGVLVVVTPGADHLEQLRGPLGLLDIQPDKQDQLESALGQTLVRQSRHRLAFELDLDAAGVYDLVAMGPNAFHLGEEQLREAARAVSEPVRVTAAVDFSLWRPRP